MMFVVIVEGLVEVSSLKVMVLFIERIMVMVMVLLSVWLRFSMEVEMMFEWLKGRMVICIIF